MQEYHEIIEYCHNRFSGRDSCTRCVYDSLCKKHDPNNINKCYCCIEKIHNFNNASLHYECEQLTFNYLIKHLNRFASENVWALDTLYHNHTPSEIFSTSIGCGPATELYALKSYFINKGVDINKIHYSGFDTQPQNIWNAIWFGTKTVFSEDDVSFSNSDLFNTNISQCDLLFLNYILSDLQKFKNTAAPIFISNLLSFISSHKPMGVIINDIFSTQVHLLLSNFVKILRKRFEKELVMINGFYFHVLKHGLEFGSRREKDILLFKQSPLENQYNPFSYCNSIQLILYIS